jgi:hypothetical protein
MVGAGELKHIAPGYYLRPGELDDSSASWAVARTAADTTAAPPNRLEPLVVAVKALQVPPALLLLACST